MKNRILGTALAAFSLLFSVHAEGRFDSAKKRYQERAQPAFEDLVKELDSGNQIAAKETAKKLKGEVRLIQDDLDLTKRLLEGDFKGTKTFEHLDELYKAISGLLVEVSTMELVIGTKNVGLGNAKEWFKKAGDSFNLTFSNLKQLAKTLQDTCDCR